MRLFFSILVIMFIGTTTKCRLEQIWFAIYNFYFLFRHEMSWGQKRCENSYHWKWKIRERREKAMRFSWFVKMLFKLNFPLLLALAWSLDIIVMMLLTLREALSTNINLAEEEKRLLIPNDDVRQWCQESHFLSKREKRLWHLTWLSREFSFLRKFK